jgi:microcystin-dependent protein
MTSIRFRSFACAVFACASTFAVVPAHAQTSPYIGQVMCGTWNFAPKGWAMMNGQLMSIAQNTSLFALMGTAFGGDGQSTFALPDMRGRTAMHIGQGIGLSDRHLGDRLGSETLSLTAAQLPPHSHGFALAGSNNEATSASPAGRVPAKGKTAQYADANGLVNMAPGVTGMTGSGASIDKMPPAIAFNCVIALQGTFPLQN